MNYKKKLFFHVSLALVTIFIFVISLNSYLVISNIETTIQNKAIEASVKIFQIYSKDSQNKDYLQNINDDYIKHFNFHFLKITDKKRNILFEQKTDQYPNIIANIKKNNHTVTIHDDKHTDIVLAHDHIHNKYYLTMKMPFKNNLFDGEISGLYDASDIKEDIYNKLLYNTLELAIMFILIFSGIYPTILLLHKGLLDKTKKLSLSNISLLETLGSAIAKRDSDTNSHNYRVTLYSIMLAEALQLPKKYFTSLIKGAFLHDIGKIGISDQILLKPAKLNDDEFKIMKTHTDIGKAIVKNNLFLQDSIDIIECHHEKFDGSGYPKGLKGEQIPLNARIFTIADVFDALTSKRPYKEPFSYEKAKSIMMKDSGKHFDPKLLHKFFEFINDYYMKLKDSDDAFLIHLLELKISIYYDKE